MMDINLKVKDLKNGEKGSVKAPSQFSEEIRPDVIARAVFAIVSHNRQPYGADPKAGMKSSAEVSRRRRKYRGSYGHGISRVPRKILSRRGTRFNWVGAFAPGTVGGRRAHPPKAEKIWARKINDKERLKAIRSAMAATLSRELVEMRGHKAPENYPFAISDDFQNITKTKDVISSLSVIGFGDEMERCRVKTIRAGKGKSRGRKYKRKTGLLVVVSDQCPLEMAGSNIPGVDVVRVSDLNASLLAPGTDIGRATVFTESALKMLNDHNLFYPKLNLFKDVVKVTKTAAKAAAKVVASKQKKESKPKKETNPKKETKPKKETDKTAKESKPASKQSKEKKTE